MARDRFMFFPNFKATADKLDDKTRLAFYDAITNYVFNDIQPDDPIISALLEAIKPSLDKVDGRQNNGGNHNPNGVNQHSKVGQSGQIRSKLVNSGQFSSETETEEETEVKEKEISDDISKKITEDTIFKAGGQLWTMPLQFRKLAKKYWTESEIREIEIGHSCHEDLVDLSINDLLQIYPPKPKKKTYGEQGKVKLTDEEYAKLQDLYGRRLENAIQILDGYLAESTKNEKKYSNHYAVMRKNNWVYNKTFDGDFVPLKPQIADMSNFVRAKPLGEEE